MNHGAINEAVAVRQSGLRHMSERLGRFLAEVGATEVFVRYGKEPEVAARELDGLNLCNLLEVDDDPETVMDEPGVRAAFTKLANHKAELDLGIASTVGMLDWRGLRDGTDTNPPLLGRGGGISSMRSARHGTASC